MSKNARTYLLLTLVLAIWGIIGYRLLSAFSPDPEAPSTATKKDYRPRKMAQKDTFQLIADYRDPFLGTLATTRKKKQVSPKSRPPQVQFPHISYTGSISGNQSKDNIFFVTIGGNQYLMNKGNTNDGVTLVQGTTENITVRYKGFRKTIPLEHASQ